MFVIKNDDNDMTELLGKWFKILEQKNLLYKYPELLGKWFKIINIIAITVYKSELLGKWFKILR